MISPTRAKITLTLCGPTLDLTSNTVTNDDKYATVFIYISWYDGRWTVDRHLKSNWFTTHARDEDALYSLLAEIDELATTK